MAWRKLKHNKGTQIARDLIFVDCETKPTEENEDNTGRHKLWFGVARSGRFHNRNGSTNWSHQDFCRFETADEFWQFAESKSGDRHTTWVYAHNAGFDFVILGLLKRVADGSLVISKPRKHRNRKTNKEQVYGLIMLEDPPTVIGVENKQGHRFVLCDTLNYWRVALSSLGKSVGLDKIDMPDYSASETEWTRYCNRDVEVIEHAIVQLITWWRDQDLGNWKWTAPGLAWSAYRHRFMSHPIIFHDVMDVRQHERNAYFGGQLEAFYIGEINEKVYQYDVVSLYPSVMQNNLYPTCLKEWYIGRDFTNNVPFDDPLSTIAEVELSPTSETFPARIGDTVFYANGPGRVTLCGPELAFAIEQGFVNTIGSYACYELCDIFTDYVRHFFELKELYESEGKTIQRNFVKLLLNSLYGKFAQRGGRWEYNPDRQPLFDFGLFWEHNPMTKQYTKHLGLYNVTFDWKPKKEIEQAAPSIAAFVTSYARQHMRMLRQVAGYENCFYMSTDSLLVNQQANNRLHEHGGLIGGNMGQLKLEIEADNAWIGGLHYYKIGDKLIEGSKKASATETINGEWSELQFDSLLSVIQRSHADPEGMDGIDIRRVTKHRTGQYYKGKVTTNGRVIPHNIQDLYRENATSH